MQQDTRVMQIQRMIDESMEIHEDQVKIHRKYSSEGNNGNEKMKNPSPSTISSTILPETIKTVSLDSKVPSSNRSFLHGSNHAKVMSNNEKTMKDKVIYATIDSLALKRTRLPLQLLPIDDNDVGIEKKDKLSGESVCREKRVNLNRKTSPKRPSFKVRPGVPVTAQWKCRGRSNPRNQAVGKFENVSKELVSRLIIFENIIRNNNCRCETLDDNSVEIGTEPEDQNLKEARSTSGSISNQNNLKLMEDPNVVSVEKVHVAKDTKSEENSKVSLENVHRNNLHTTDDRNDDWRCENNEIGVIEQARLNAEPTNVITTEKSLVSESADIETLSCQKNLLESGSASTSSSSLTSKTKRYKPEFGFAKSVFHYVPITSNAKRTKKSNNSSKHRQQIAKSNLQSNKNKNLSREELRDVSISLPTNFVHLASATNSRLLPNGETISNSKRIITHEEKCAKLAYLGNSDLHEIEIVKSSSSKVKRKIGKNTIDEGTTYVDMKLKSQLNSFDVAGQPVDIGNSIFSSSSCSSSTSSNTSLGENGVDNDENRAKVVSSLENSQGVPQVVKRSENEGKYNDQVKGAEYRSDEEEEQDDNDDDDGDEDDDDDDGNESTPVYEAMSEFSICTSGPPVSSSSARANASFLWSGRITRSAEKDNTIVSSTKVNDEIISSLHETTEQPDNLIEENGYDAYDDVGLSHCDTEEDHYDDVGLPSMGTQNLSSETVFEEIDNIDEELYDDVSPGPITKVSETFSMCVKTSNEESVSPTKLTPENLTKSCPKDKSEKPDISNASNGLFNSSFEIVELRERNENQYLTISNEYSSVEEGLDDIEGASEDVLYDDVGLPSREHVNSIYAGSSSGSQLGSLYNGKESEWEDLEDVAPVLPLPKKNNVVSRHADSQGTTNKKKGVHRWSRKVRRQKSKVSRKNPASRSTSRAATKGTTTFSDTASDDSNYETLFSFPSDEFSSGSDDEDSTLNASRNNADSSLHNRVNETCQEAPSRPVPPPPRESSLTETFGKRMKILRRTWSITKGSLGRMRRRASTTAETETHLDDGGKYSNCDQQQCTNNDGRKYFSFKKHFRKSLSGLSTFYLDNDNNEGRLSRNNNRSKEEVYSNGSNNSWYTNSDFWKNSVTEHETQRNDIDHYSMLDEEPLYQFYAAAAARVAFESDSEGYEEVEDPCPSPSATELAKPGHRTLWCQTPQVINSSLLQRLSSDEKKVQEAKFEIFTSEASYLNSLRVLVNEFLNNHDLVYEVLTPSEREKLFGGVPSVLLASERLLAELETIWREDVMLGGLPDVLMNYAQRSSSVYVAYCSNQVSIDTTLKELRNKKGSKFVETVTRIESHPACQSLTLHSFLMLPMQRVTRLPLLADAVLSKLSMDNKDDRTSWECVLSQLSQVVMECNEGARAAGRLAEMETLERKLEYSTKVPPIILRDRYLVRRGPVVQLLAKPDMEYKLTFGKRYHKTSLYLLLLTDYLLIAKPKTNTNDEVYTVIDTCKRSLVALEKVTEESPYAGRNAMVLSLLENYLGRHVEYILTCNNATERERWLDAVSPPKPSLVGETLYETWDCPQVMVLYPYAAAQPDELTLQPGDVINVLRKMTDGWHLGEKLLGGEQGWFPGNYAKEVASEHVRARNLRQRHRLLALSASVLQQRAKQMSRLH